LGSPRRGATALDYFYNESSARIKGVAIISSFLQPAYDLGSAKKVSFASLGMHPTPTRSPLVEVKSSDLTRDADIQKQMMKILLC
jgi:alpha-beta hydrolase superfamily lysophospholipase